MSNASNHESGPAHDAGPLRLRDALRKARIEAADRTAVVVDLRDAELARLEILNEALDPIFVQVPDHVEMFDRGVSRGETPRLWIDMVAHVVMGRDKRMYRFVQDTRHGRVVLAESHAVPDIVDAVTNYIARRLIEREQVLDSASQTARELPQPVQWKPDQWKPRRSRFWTFLLGVLVGAAALFGAALLASLRGF